MDDPRLGGPRVEVAHDDRPVLVTRIVSDEDEDVRPVLRLCATFDHRIIDGFSAGVLAREIRSLVESPEQSASLEEAFMELTRESVEFHAEALPVHVPVPAAGSAPTEEP